MRCSKVDADRQLRTSHCGFWGFLSWRPFIKSEFPTILGNVLQNLQVIRPFSYMIQSKSESHESWDCLLTFFSAAMDAFGFTLTALLAGMACTISTSSMDDHYLLLCHHYHPFSLKNLIIFTAGTFSHVYVYTRYINKDQYQFYALDYFDFKRKITFNMAITKIESMKENYPEFLVTNLNYAGHQI